MLQIKATSLNCQTVINYSQRAYTSPYMFHELISLQIWTSGVRAVVKRALNLPVTWTLSTLRVIERRCQLLRLHSVGDEWMNEWMEYGAPVK
jgi:hypothetical protein